VFYLFKHTVDKSENSQNNNKKKTIIAFLFSGFFCVGTVGVARHAATYFVYNVLARENLLL
jgi:hypothetical protein